MLTPDNDIPANDALIFEIPITSKHQIRSAINKKINAMSRSPFLRDVVAPLAHSFHPISCT
ncbi:hypothetical protein EAE99_000017 [Botrytis elliptica]|nr:hypothetical protein EAE99_000017 [Botrytis elliptica]